MAVLNWLAWIPAGVLSATIVGDWLDRWIARHTESTEWGCVISKKRWSFLRIRNPVTGAERRGFYLRLPSWAWELDVYRDEYCWLQRTLVWFDDTGWRTVLIRSVEDGRA